MAKVRKKIRRRKGVVLGYNPWNMDAEPGDYMVDLDGRVCRLEESTGRNKRDAGELTPRWLKPPVEGARGVKVGNEIYWEWDE